MGVVGWQDEWFDKIHQHSGKLWIGSEKPYQNDKLLTLSSARAELLLKAIVLSCELFRCSKYCTSFTVGYELSRPLIEGAIEVSDDK